MEFFFPIFKKQLVCAQQAADGCDVLRPSNSPPPMSMDIMSAIAQQLKYNGHVNAAYAIALSFSGYLRAGEAIDLRSQDIFLPGDIRLAGIQDSSRAGLLMRTAKTDTNQFVSI